MSKMFHTNLTNEEAGKAVVKAMNEGKLPDLKRIIDRFESHMSKVLESYFVHGDKSQVGMKPEDRLTAMALEAKADNAILLLTLDDPELYNAWINHPYSFIEPKSFLPGIVMGSFLGVKVHMSFREEDRPSYEGL